MPVLCRLGPHPGGPAPDGRAVHAGVSDRPGRRIPCEQPVPRPAPGPGRRVPDGRVVCRGPGRSECRPDQSPRDDSGCDPDRGAAGGPNRLPGRVARGDEQCRQLFGFGLGGRPGGVAAHRVPGYGVVPRVRRLLVPVLAEGCPCRGADRPRAEPGPAPAADPTADGPHPPDVPGPHEYPLGPRRLARPGMAVLRTAAPAVERTRGSKGRERVGRRIRGEAAGSCRVPHLAGGVTGRLAGRGGPGRREGPGSGTTRLRAGEGADQACGPGCGPLGTRRVPPGGRAADQIGRGRAQVLERPTPRTAQAVPIQVTTTPRRGGISTSFPGRSEEISFHMSAPVADGNLPVATPAPP